MMQMWSPFSNLKGVGSAAGCAASTCATSGACCPGVPNTSANNATAGTTLTFEYGPSQTIQLQWGTYYDAADQAGLSRLWGGIHVSVDDLGGRRVGSQCGKGVWARAQKYFDGSVSTPTVAIRRLDSGQLEVRYNTFRGFNYAFQSTPDLNQPFTNDPPGTSKPFDALTVVRTNAASGPMKFHRVITRSAP